MPKLFERDCKELLVFAAMLEGCGYYGCKDDLKQNYVPKQTDTSWLDAQTLEVDFHAALRPPTEVDPQRFALLRYNVKFDNSSDYYCHFDVCYRELTVEGIPESLDWDPAEPGLLRLHFADPIPSSSCEPWKGNRADFQALELIYRGVEEDDGTDTGDDPLPAESDQLAYDDDLPVEALGPDRARARLALCVTDGTCEFEFCTDRGGYYDFDNLRKERNLWVDCP
jgi:hypothetical protein